MFWPEYLIFFRLLAAGGDMTQSKRRDELAKVRRESIIDAAERVFFRKGYLDATVDEIVKEAEYSKRTVYVYIKSKAEMYDEVALRAYAAQYDFISAVKDSGDPVRELRDIIKEAVRFVDVYPGYTSVIVNYHIRLADSPDTVPNEINEQDAKLLGAIEAVISRGVDKGVFVEDGIAFMTTYLVSVFMGVVDMLLNKKHYLMNGRKIDPAEFVTKSIDMLMRSILK